MRAEQELMQQQQQQQLCGGENLSLVTPSFCPLLTERWLPDQQDLCVCFRAKEGQACNGHALNLGSTFFLCMHVWGRFFEG